MARAPALHAGGQGFDSLILHAKRVQSSEFKDVLNPKPGTSNTKDASK